MTINACLNNLNDEKVITFLNGILGLEDYKKYIILDHPESDVIKWIQSVDEPQIALPVVNPYSFYPDYAPEISEEDLKRLKISSAEEALALCVITISQDTSTITVNLKAPIIINVSERLADQLIAENADYSIRQPLDIRRIHDDRRCKSC
ncbi:flagellar assembly factor FliW [Tepidanaerobacter syntrophicus]|uniref:Flagellar assembly factor FliW n=1 Tax=Tepidanaerobacter syntrophicus TaxID=224999 RepID=A0A0U9HJB0_9FIRM|nr:flagellar assembly protein FliW [Tepidanaerobacter syntrophicus]GAQ24371.1 flagellar assembly factor FliW [Tepidanaerobacter syntrophicus]GLI52107.1 flagellar assembly factor FliW [Tepidanaerobacter syntrophicus]HHV82801.1 flagellar assembly protein FliW [Tepidanaerobacter syntrophicus]